MSSTNPFTAMLPEKVPPGTDETAFVECGLIYGCEALWDMLAAMPNKAEATLAQRRLEETVFWGRRAAGAVA